MQPDKGMRVATSSAAIVRHLFIGVLFLRRVQAVVSCQNPTCTGMEQGKLLASLLQASPICDCSCAEGFKKLATGDGAWRAVGCMVVSYSVVSVSAGLGVRGIGCLRLYPAAFETTTRTSSLGKKCR